MTAPDRSGPGVRITLLANERAPSGEPLDLAGRILGFTFEDAEKKVDEERDRLRRILNMSVNEIELSVRAANCLNNANITTVGELAMKTEADMLKYRNFGKKSLNEIKDKLTELGLYLGYKFDPELLEANK